MKEKFTQKEMMSLLDKLYDQCVRGVERVSPPIKELAEGYLSKHKNVESAAESFVRCQVMKCTTSGFLTGLGGIITLPIAIPANIGNVLYVQMRMVGTLAYMRGYDIHSDQVQTLIYACLAGISVDQILKQAGIKFGNKFLMNMVKKIPGEVLTKINQKVGFRFITKFGSTGIINLGKIVPGIGGVIGGGMDFLETKAIARRAYKLFIKEDYSVLMGEDQGPIEGEVIL